jgi:hypothetical protein
VSVIIIRPTGGRRFAYATFDGHSNTVWKDHPNDAFFFPSPAAAQEYQKEHKANFGPDDRLVTYRAFDAQHCQMCFSEDPTLRRNATQYDNKSALIELQCSHCNQIVTAVYGYETCNRGPIA